MFCLVVLLQMFSKTASSSEIYNTTLLIVNTVMEIRAYKIPTPLLRMYAELAHLVQ